MRRTIEALTDKEKEALRLILRGHDAKSSARELDLSVHTINERLRGARRKLEVTSSKEAARMLFESEGGTYENLAYDDLGAAPASESPDPSTGRFSNRYVIGGFVIMLAFALFATLVLSSHPGTERPVGDPATALETVQLDQFETVARDWLAIVDTFDWDASFAAAGRSFRDPNTVDMWREASKQARVPLGKIIERTPTTVDLIQSGRDEASAKEEVVVRFASRFENRSDAVETVTLEKEYGEWKVVGYVIE